MKHLYCEIRAYESALHNPAKLLILLDWNGVMQQLLRTLPFDDSTL